MSNDQQLLRLTLATCLLLIESSPTFAAACERLDFGSLRDKAPPRQVRDNVVSVFATEPLKSENAPCFFVRLERVPLADFVRLVLGDVLGVSYTVQTPLIGEVSIRSDKGLSIQHLGSVAELLLAGNGYVLEASASGVFTIAARRTSATVPPSLVHRQKGHRKNGVEEKRFARDELGSTLTVVPLRFLSAQTALDGLAPFAGKDTLLAGQGDQRSIFIYGNHQTLTYLRSLLKIIDVDTLSSVSFAAVRVEHTDPVTVFSALQSILGVATQDERSAAAAPIALAVDEEAPEISIISRSEHQMNSALKWIARLDVPNAIGGDRKIRIFKPEHREPSVILQLLQNIVRDEIGGNELERAFQRASVIADNESDSIIMLARSADAHRLRRLFASIDRPSRRIEVKATIIEVIFNDASEFGTSWQSINGLGERYDGLARLFGENLTQSRRGGFNYAVFNSDGISRVLFSALSSLGVVNVVSSPSVSMLSGGSAFVRAGEQRPVPVSRVEAAVPGGTADDPTSPSSLPPFEQLQVEYRDIGVSLRVTANASAAGVVKLSIQQETTDIGPLLQVTPDIRANIFLDRAIETTVTLPSGMSVVLSGLQRENTSESNAGILLLNRIPFFGPLFGNRRNTRVKTELLVVLTPEVLPIRQPVGRAADGYVTTELTTALERLKAPQ